MTNTDTPAHQVSAYTVWRNTPGRDYASAARTLAMSEETLRDLARTERWQERSRDDDAADIAGITDAAIVELAALVPDACKAIADVIPALGDDRGKPAFAPLPVSIRASWQLLSLFGVTPARVSAMLITSDQQAPAVTATMLASLLSSGDTATLLALAQGRDVPTIQHPGRVGPPTDFLSTHAAGREGLTRYPSETQGSVQDPSQVAAAVALSRKRELAPEEWDTVAIIEGEVRDVAAGKRRRRKHDE